MSYITPYYNESEDKFYITERFNGQRIINTLKPIYEFYVEDDFGNFEATNGKHVKKITAKNRREFMSLKKQYSATGKRTYEMSFDTSFKVLEKYYAGAPSPKIRKCFLDIECDVVEKQPFGGCPNCNERINCITLYCEWIGKSITFCLKPIQHWGGKEPISKEEALSICKSIGDDIVLCDTEEELLKKTAMVIRESDVISGWASEFLDVPYILGRAEKLLGTDFLAKFSPLDVPATKRLISETGDKKTYEWTIPGIVHIDYLKLYKKRTPEKKDSYKLDAIAEEVVGERKVEHDETLGELYHTDFKKFIVYNKQDTLLVWKIDKELDYIEIGNLLAHEHCCTIESTMGTVAWVQQALNKAAHTMGLVVPDRVQLPEPEGLMKYYVSVGGWVKNPEPAGFWRWIGSTDINSLYPSIIRALNMSPETLVAQIKNTYTEDYLIRKIEENHWFQKGKPDFTRALEGVFCTKEYEMVIHQTDDPLEIEFLEGGTITMPAKKVYDLIFVQNKGKLCLSANGTIIRTDKQGILAKVLGDWFADRKKIKKEMNHYKELVATETDDAKRAEYQAHVEDLDRRQYLKKIQLNSTYGALGTPKMVWGDIRMMRSTCFTGRCITRGMAWCVKDYCDAFAEGRPPVNSDHDVTMLGSDSHEYLVTVDTDSNYFSVYNEYKKRGVDFKFNKKNVLKLYDDIGEYVNSQFSHFMVLRFGVDAEHGAIIKAARENVATTGLYVMRKRYAMLAYNTDGLRQDTDIEGKYAGFIELDGKEYLLHEDTEDDYYYYEKDGNRVRLSYDDLGSIPIYTRANGEKEQIHYKYGKLKVTGLDIRRADCPKKVRDMLKKMLQKLLLDGTEKDLQKIVRDFKNKDWNEIPAWYKGRPCSVKGIDEYTEKLKSNPKATVPGHVRASMNWNALLVKNQDFDHDTIVDTNDIIVCKLLPTNIYNINSIAFPVDMVSAPKWFKELPFDTSDMTYKVIDKKIDNIFSTLNWKLSLADCEDDNSLDEFLTFD